MHQLVFIAIAVTWGSGFILMKKAGLAFGPLTIGGLRLVAGVAVLLLLLALRGQRWRPHGQQWAWLLLVVAISYAWPYTLQPWLITRYGSGFIGMMVAFVPLLTMVAQVPLLGQRPTGRQLVGIAGGLVCLYLILEDGRDRAVPLAALALAVTVPLGYAVGNTLVRRHFATVATLPLTAWALGLAALMVLPLAMLREEIRDPEQVPLALGCLAILGLLGTGLCIAGLYWLIQKRGPLWAGMVTYIIPIGAVLWGWVDGEIVTPLQLAAMAGVLVMVALVQSAGRRSPRFPSA